MFDDNPPNDMMTAAANSQFYTVQVNANCSFVLRGNYFPKYYDHPHSDKIMNLGEGIGGIVIACVDLTNNQNVAIKKISNIFDGDIHIMKRISRELTLLRLLSAHPNVVSFLDVYCTEDTFDLYLVMELLNTDLRKDMFFAMKKNNPFHPMKTKYILYGILKGLQYIHQRGVLHRDMKPSNILLSTSKVSLCDFGHANTIRSVEERTPNDSKYVITRMYRPPEIILDSETQTPAVDIFSVGCIFAEMLFCEQNPPIYRHLFPADDSCSLRHEGGGLKHLQCMISVLGTPDISDVIGSKDAIYIFSNQQWFREKVNGPNLHSEFFPASSKEAVDLLNRMLPFNPHKRCTVEEALHSDYFKDIATDPFQSHLFNLDYSVVNLPQEVLDFSEFKDWIDNEIQLFHYTKSLA